MAKTKNNNQPVAIADNDVKKRKKQAKREAKLMLQLELARKDVTKAQQKLAKAENTLQTRNTLLNELEQQLAQLRGTEERVAVFELQPEPAISALDPGDIYEEDETIAELHKAEQEPAEGREDISTTPESKPAVDEELAETLAETTATDLQQEDLSISSGAGSIDILTQDEHAWPPSEVREELVEGIAAEVKEDEAKEQQQNETDTTKTSKQSTKDADKGEHGSGSEETVQSAGSNGKAATTRRRNSRRRSTTAKTETTKTDTTTD